MDAKKCGLSTHSLLSEGQRVLLRKSSFERVVAGNSVEFWRWQPKVIEKKWQEMNQKVEVTVRWF
jgi:hypothetical protein